MIVLVKSGYERGSSIWHIEHSTTNSSIVTKCEALLRKPDYQRIPMPQYNGGRRISMCSYCLKEVH